MDTQAGVGRRLWCDVLQKGRCVALVLPIPGLLAALLLWAAAASAVRAEPYSDLVIFGDSLSDVGNVWIYTNHAEPPQTYWQGRFSNGPLWVEDLAAPLNVPVPTPFLADGTDCAVGGATTDANFPNVLYVVNLYLSQVPGGPVDPHALYVVWAGANDFWNALGTNPTATDVANCTSAMRAEWAGNLASAVGLLHAAGAENFLVLNLPPLGNTPRYLSNPNQAAINAEVVDFNNQLFAGMTALENTYTDLSVQTVDTYGLFNQIVADPGSYGLDNVTDQSINTPGAGSRQVPILGRHSSDGRRPRAAGPSRCGDDSRAGHAGLVGGRGGNVRGCGRRFPPRILRIL